jgi:hypothetical protein
VHLLVNLNIFDNARHKNQNYDASIGKVSHEVQDYQTEVTENKRRNMA